MLHGGENLMIFLSIDGIVIGVSTTLPWIVFIMKCFSLQSCQPSFRFSVIILFDYRPCGAIPPYIPSILLQFSNLWHPLVFVKPHAIFFTECTRDLVHDQYQLFLCV